MITRYFHITCKCIFYLKVGRENCDHNAQGDLFREFRGYHKSWKQNFWLCQNGLHVKHWPAHHVSLRLRQKLIYIDFQFAAKTLAFQDNFLQFQIFYLLFDMFFSSGKHVIKNLIYENWNFESFN